MAATILKTNLLSDGTIFDVLARDSVLWIGAEFEHDEHMRSIVAQVVGLPWRFVLCESSSPDFIKLLESTHQENDQLSRRRGHIHLVASDPRDQTFAPRALPIFLLNGRGNAAQGPESTQLGGRAAMRRRLNMLAFLERLPPRRLFAVNFGESDLVADLQELWKDNFRALLTFISDVTSDSEKLEQWSHEHSSPLSIENPTSRIPVVLSDLYDRARSQLPDDRLVVRIRLGKDFIEDHDLTSAELPEHPLLEDYELVTSDTLLKITPDDLSENELSEFFSGSHQSWLPYAADLPWSRDRRYTEKILEALDSTGTSGADEIPVFIIPTQSGAGATTQLRAIAFEAAGQGFPSLVGRPTSFRPDALPITSFLFRCKKLLEVTGNGGTDVEPSWLITFDVQHWQGREDVIQAFIAELNRSGRRIVCVITTSDSVPDSLSRIARAVLPKLIHEISIDDALALGRHLNIYLRKYNREQSEGDWKRFWQNHSPTFESPIASFWIALEFWLKGQLDLSTSVQSWLTKQFQDAPISVDARAVIAEIASLTLERKPYPEGLSGRKELDELPLGVRLEQLRSEIPSLALLSARSAGQYVWAFAHDLLARYLLNGLATNRSLLVAMGFSEVEDAIDLRLAMLRRITSRDEFAELEYRDLANDFATQILKLDPDAGSEFFPRWRAVLDILDEIPSAIRQSSRTFCHHVAISRRRVATHQHFDPASEEREEQLSKAIEDLKFAIESIPRTQDDEGDLNLLNSLSLAYQNMAEIKAELGASLDEVAALRIEAHQATQRALTMDPTNSYVLETAARNMLQHGKLKESESAKAASEALSYIFQAVSLENSEARQYQLTRLANRALELLRAKEARNLISKGDQKGKIEHLLARAWLALMDGYETIESLDISEIPKENVDKAVEIVEEASSGYNWLILKFYYDLVAAQTPNDFQRQVTILDDLVGGTGFHAPPQIELEYAILLHEIGRHQEAKSKYMDLRKILRDSEAYVSVPDRLRWLYAQGSRDKQICEAVVSDDMDDRGWARVRALGSVTVPFRPQEFGRRQMRPGEHFTCNISFGIRGPFIRPVIEDRRSHRR